MTTEGQPEMTVPWTPGLGGMLAPDLSLLRRPMKPGERRTVRHLTIADNQASETELTARQEESVPLLAGTFRLLRIDMRGATVRRARRSRAWSGSTGGRDDQVVAASR